MRYRLLGRSGLRVSEVALGSGTFGTAWGWGSDRDTCKTIFDAFLEAGGNFIDSASGYQDGEAETFIGEFVKGERANIVINTKYSGPPFKGAGVAATGNSRKAMTQSLESSLRRLGCDYVDVFMVHFADGLTPMEEIVRGFEDVIRSGKANYVGFSDFPAWRIARGATLAELARLPVAAIQIEFSLAQRTAERELLPMAEGLGLGVTLWSVLGGGLLSGKYRRPGAQGRLSQGGGLVLSESGERERTILDTLQQTAASVGCTPAQAAIAWARAWTGRWNTSVIPILGARTLPQLEENLAALSVELTEAQVDALARASAIELGFPHELLASDMIKNLGFAGRWDQIVKPSRPVA